MNKIEIKRKQTQLRAMPSQRGSTPATTTTSLSDRQSRSALLLSLALLTLRPVKGKIERDRERKYTYLATLCALVFCQPAGFKFMNTNVRRRRRQLNNFRLLVERAVGLNELRSLMTIELELFAGCWLAAAPSAEWKPIERQQSSEQLRRGTSRRC